MLHPSINRRFHSGFSVSNRMDILVCTDGNRVCDYGRPSDSRSKGITFFAIQFILNLACCFIFFGAGNYMFSLAELIVMFLAVIAMTVFFGNVDSLASKLQIPYILWLGFATYLALA